MENTESNELEKLEKFEKDVSFNDIVISKIHRAINGLIQINSFYAYILMGCKFKEGRVKNIAITTDRRGDLVIIYNPVSIRVKGTTLLQGLILHELMHLINKHYLIIPKDKRDKAIWHMAQDAAVNQFIPQLDAFSTPLNVLIEEGHGTDNDIIFVGPPVNMLNKTAEEYHEYILREMLRRDNFDIEAFSKKLSSDVEMELDVPIEMVIELSQQRIGKAFNLFQNELPAGMQQNIQLAVSKPLINWQNALRIFAGLSQRGDKYSTPFKPNRRYDDQPGWRYIYEPKLAVIVDTSGSIIDEEFNLFLSEVEALAKEGAELTVIQVDKSVTFVGKYKFGDWKQFEVWGGGETDLQPAVDLAQTHLKSEGIVIFTDGFVDLPKISRRVLFILSHKHNPEFYLDAKRVYGNVFILG
ncbi:MAG: VWA-like domain-containing protein [Fervidobacterium sp.]